MGIIADEAPLGYPDAKVWKELTSAVRRSQSAGVPIGGATKMSTFKGLISTWNLKTASPEGSSHTAGAKRSILSPDLVMPIPPFIRFNGGNAYTGGSNVTAGDLNGLVLQNQSQVLVVDNSGKFCCVRLGDNGRLDQKRAAAMAAEFNASGAILLSALLPQETGYWNPAVTTGADGTAKISLTLPERSTAWKFLAKGLSAETLAGEATDDLTVKKDLFGEIKLPLAFTDGDTAEIPVTVHNETIEKGPIEVVLRTTIAGRRVEETKTIEVASKGLKEVSFKVELKRPEGRGKGGEKGRKGDAVGKGTDDHPTDPTDRIDFELVLRSGGTRTSSSVRCRCAPTACRCSRPPAVRAPPTARSGWRPPRA